MDLNILVSKDEIKATGEKKTFTIPGLSNKGNNIYDVYRIPLDYLFYNDQNGRINTMYMKYLSENDSLIPCAGESQYNSIFEEFIYKSNRNALDKTIKSIAEKGQQEPGVVLPDGRIIDGNRRFTTLRKLQRSTGVAQYFNAVILPIGNESEANKKTIKALELDLQLGREERVDYDPIDKIYDVYDTIIIKKQMSTHEYRKAAGYGNVTPIINDLKRAELMIDFINLISPGEGPEKKFYLIRDLKLDGPIKEIDTSIDKLSGVNKVAIKDAILVQMLLAKTSLVEEEPTKAMRALIHNVIKKPEFTEYYLNAVDSNVDIILDGFENNPISSVEEIEEIIYKDETILEAAKKMVSATDKLVYRGGLDTKKSKALSQMLDVFDKMGNIDVSDFDELTEDQRIEMRHVIKDIKDLLYHFGKGMNNGV